MVEQERKSIASQRLSNMFPRQQTSPSLANGSPNTDSRDNG
jgi:hypothetical protein